MNRHTHTAATKTRQNDSAINIKTTQVTKNADIKATIDAMNPNCPRYQAHATLHYNMGRVEKQAEKSSRSYESQLQSQGQGPLRLESAGRAAGATSAPYDMRAIGLRITERKSSTRSTPRLRPYSGSRTTRSRRPTRL